MLGAEFSGQGLEMAKAVIDATEPEIEVLTTILAMLPSPISVLPPLKPNQ